jgi:hypothetical protein
MAPLETAMMRPKFCLIMTGMTGRRIENKVFKLRFNMRSQTASEVSWIFPGANPPAIAKTKSRRPERYAKTAPLP